MEFKPDTLSINIVDFLGILVPGAVICLLVLAILNEKGILSSTRIEIGKGTAAFCFFLGCYLFGQFVFGLSGALDILDKNKIPWNRIFHRNPEAPIGTLELIKARQLIETNGAASGQFLSGKIPVQLSTNKNDDVDWYFDWAKAYVLKRDPRAFNQLEHYRAEAKLFRSLVVICLVLAITVCRWKRIPQRQRLAWSLVCLALAILTFSKFSQRRWEEREETFRYFLISEPAAGGGDVPHRAAS